jgi:hypothetical protein
MKKLFMILAASAVLFACGGNGNNNSNKAEKGENTENTGKTKKAEKAKKQTVEGKAVSYAKQIMKAIEAGDMDKAEKIMADMEAWGETLTPAEQRRAEEAQEKYLYGSGALDDEYGYEEYGEEDYGDYGDYEEEDYGDYEDEDYGDYEDEDYGDYEDYDEEW